MKKASMLKRVISIGMVVALSVSVFAGCTGGGKTGNGKVKLHVGQVPVKDTPEYERFVKGKEKFLKLHPEVEFVEDSWSYSVDTFMAKAASNDLPCYWYAPMTEFTTFTNGGYIADVTDMVKEYGYEDTMNEQVLEQVKKDGKYYGIPHDTSIMGLIVNKELFKQAGLTDENGYVKAPQTYEQLAEYAATINEKTGKTGFSFPSMNNAGGWLFTNVAWAFGADFVKLENGKYKAAFNTRECKNALQWIKDLKWKYNAFAANAYVNGDEAVKLLASDQAAMTLMAPSDGTIARLVTSYGANKDNIAVVNMPEGKAGRCALLGGGFFAFDKNLDDAQKKATFELMQFNGYGTSVTEQSKSNMIKTYEEYAEKNSAIGPEYFEAYKSGEIKELRDSLRKKFLNVDLNDYKEYDPSKVVVKKEVSVCGQELYAILDGCIQEVLTNENADIDSLLKKAANDYQVNYLDNYEM